MVHFGILFLSLAFFLGGCSSEEEVQNPIESIEWQTLGPGVERDQLVTNAANEYHRDIERAYFKNPEAVIVKFAPVHMNERPGENWYFIRFEHPDWCDDTGCITVLMESKELIHSEHFRHIFLTEDYHEGNRSWIGIANGTNYYQWEQTSVGYLYQYYGLPDKYQKMLER